MISSILEEIEEKNGLLEENSRKVLTVGEITRLLQILNFESEKTMLIYMDAGSSSVFAAFLQSPEPNPAIVLSNVCNTEASELSSD
jgi:hypothetical protein